MSRMGLIGPSYASQSPNLDAESCINWYPEADDGGAGNAPIAMYPTPGTKVFATLLTGGGSGAAGTFDKAVENIGGGLGPATSSGAPSTISEVALVLAACGFNGQPVGAPDVSWSFLDNPDSVETSLYTKALSGVGAISSSQSVALSTNWLTKLMFFGAKVAGVHPTIVQRRSIVSGAISPGGYSASFASNTNAANGILVVISGGATTNFLTSVTVSDPKGNVYTQIGSLQNSGGLDVGFLNTPHAAVFWSPTTHGLLSTDLITVTTVNGGHGTGVLGSIIAYEISGIGPVLSSNGPVRGELFINGRAFAVSGNGFFELFANGTFTNWGVVANDALPVTMAASPQQLLLASAGTAYVFDLMANTLTAIAGATFPGPVAQAGICDDFFLLTIQNSKEFFVSAPLNANDWVTNGAAIVSVFPDNIVSMFVFQRQIWFFSDTQSVVYYDSGNIFPFDVNPNAFIEAGCAAENSVAQMNNALFWLGADARGHGKLWTANGYTPSRVSNHAFEFAVQSYTRIDDAVGFSYQDQGHEFYVLYFPTPSIMWVFDAATGMLHQRGFWIESIGQFKASHYQNHMFTFGKHLVGDWQSGNVYELHIPVALAGGLWDFVTDAGNPIRRVRRAPHISREQKRQFHVELQVFLESGLGPTPPLLDGAGNARDPQIMLRWSDDSAHTWSNEHVRNCGKSGEYSKRVRWLQLGSARDRIYELSASDPIPYRVVDGYLQIAEGTGI